MRRYPTALLAITPQNTVRLAAVILLLLFGSGCSHLVNHSRDNERAKIYLQMAADHFAERDYNKSLEACFEALKYSAHSGEAYNQMALVYMETKRYQKAEEAFSKALELQPDYPEVQNNMGVLFNRQEKYQKAITHFQKALSYPDYKTPENAYTNMGFAYFKLGETAKAKNFHQRALDVVPQFCLAEKNLGDVYTKDKHYNKAAEYYERAVVNCPLYQESQYKLGLVLMKMGQKKVAKAQLEKLVQKHKKGPYVDRSNEVLRFLH